MTIRADSYPAPNVSLTFLSDGSRWKQVDRTADPVYRERPTTRLHRRPSTGVFALDVQATSAIAQVMASDYGVEIQLVGCRHADPASVP
jgi:hypothetical protein